MRSLLLLASMTVLAGSASAQLRSQTADGQTIGGVSCDRQEGQRVHIHQHLVIFDHGKEVAVPYDVGRPNLPCLYWLHTHTPDGIIHIEAPVERSFTLGDFFRIWGQPLTKSVAATAKASGKEPLRVWVDGKPYSGDPAKIPLKAHTDIVIEAGPPFPKPPRFTNWGTL
jgi:hypothetical protein